ncbi:UvrD-helicase domain-containing protein [Desulfosporosinus sp. BG]|uniref:UvrD-helicase domain-containing protein n=1 Tax=Desulfosporosinus sp. BG TaxID=1633135 RepID=UPI00083A7654|nr:UvrD-helicase domain-containing protein [Desulfosporosinus sp. BG]ODA43040.1 ATP-dependent DNA helicase UvrD/PcrA [Desulfosporosinus sp. BG]
MIEGKQKELLDMLASGEPYVLVEAPAGTGKTFCCIQAAKCLCDNNMLLPFQKALVLTFSRNARAQLIKELSKIPAESPIHKQININNYHSFFKKYLDAYRDIIGIKKPLSIIDNDDFIELLYDYANNESIALREGLEAEILDDYLNDGGTLTLLNQESKNKRIGNDAIAKFLDTASQFTQVSGYICFAQFGNLVCQMLNTSTQMAKAISHDYPLLILDEYQDTNYYQEQFVKQVLKSSKGIFFADEWQMIYGFRGSTADRLNELPVIYTSIKKLVFTDYYRYKDKPDLIAILKAIRANSKLDYSELANGSLIPCRVACDDNWQNIKGKSHTAQCTLFCSGVFYSTIKIVISLLKQNKSVAILCRRNNVANRLTEVFFENNMHPRTVSDTPEMSRISKQIKRCLEPVELQQKIPALLSIAALCTMNRKIDGEDVSMLSMYDSRTLSRKRKPILSQIWLVIKPYLTSTNIADCWVLLTQIITILVSQESVTINYARKRYVEHCTRSKELTPNLIDNIMMQRQYIDSFTNINPGLYITTIHQSKGKEFDCVFVVDIDDVIKDANLLYVSHSRMKERLYPIKAQYKGVSYR